MVCIKYIVSSKGDAVVPEATVCIHTMYISVHAFHFTFGTFWVKIHLYRVMSLVSRCDIINCDL